MNIHSDSVLNISVDGVLSGLDDGVDDAVHFPFDWLWFMERGVIHPLLYDMS